MNTKLKALPHPTAKDIGQTAVVKNIESLIQNNVLEFQFDAKKFPVTALALYSPELGGNTRNVSLNQIHDKVIMKVDLTDIAVYAVAQ